MDRLDSDLARVAAVLAEDRVVRRVIKKHRRLPGMGLQVPHARCYALPRAELWSLVQPGELRADPEALPDRVVLIGGDRSRLAAGEPRALSEAWRAIFHGRVHLALDDRIDRQAITAATVRARIHHIGQTEFDEIRAVLREEDLLLPPVDDVATYAEFVALYLELRRFAPSALDRTFPALDMARVDAAIALDLDADAVLASARPERAPGRPIVDTPSQAVRIPTELVPVVDAAAAAGAVRARAKGNRARAAILALRAGDRSAARDDLAELCAQLGRAIGCAVQPDWAAALLPVAELAAAQRVVRFTSSARLLFDVQSACIVGERETRAIDLAGWMLSLGRRPIVRRLPATREVRVLKHLRSAADKVAACDLHAAELDRLAAALRDIVERCDAAARAALRPKIEAALDEVDLRPTNLPERVAEKKLIDELLDQAVTAGQLSIGQLRDAISRNDLKMPDLSRHQLRSGDALLRCDLALSRSLDGVYRRGEIYLRFLQKLSSILFGTHIGRFLSLYVILPLLGSYTVFKGLQEVIDLVTNYTHRASRELELLTDPQELLAQYGGGKHGHHHHGPQIATDPAILIGAAVLFLLLHVPPFRRGVVAGLRLLWRVVRFILFDAPRALLQRPLVRRFLASWFTRWLLRPAVPAALCLLITDDVIRWPLAGGLFILVALGLNSRTGRDAQELLEDGVVRAGHVLTSRIVPGALSWILDIFRELMEVLDRAIYRVDEWLRFRAGQSRLTLVAKAALGAVWSVIAYFLRLYVTLFIEPGVNPIKHFPVVTVAAKLLYPISPQISSAIGGPINQLMGTWLGTTVTWFTVFVLPGVAGFLVWELKENWKLYRKTRAKDLRPVSIGHHGETMVGFLKPAFHSGTVPKRFTKLRRAAWKTDELAVAHHREELHHIEERIHKFADRELVALLNEAETFRAPPVAAGRVAVGSNRVRIELLCPKLSAEPASIVLEHQSGWIVASLPEHGWLTRLSNDQREIFQLALRGFYKRAGVDLIREQLEHALAPDGPPPPYDLTSDGLVVWPGHGFQSMAIYDLRAAIPTPRMQGAPWAGELPQTIDRHALFFRTPLTWASWTSWWDQMARGETPSMLLGPDQPPARATALAG